MSGVRKVHVRMCPVCEALEMASKQPRAIRDSFTFILGYVTASSLQRSGDDARDEGTKSGFFCAEHGRRYRKMLAVIDEHERALRRKAS